MKPVFHPPGQKEALARWPHWQQRRQWCGMSVGRCGRNESRAQAPAEPAAAKGLGGGVAPTQGGCGPGYVSRGACALNGRETAVVSAEDQGQGLLSVLVSDAALHPKLKKKNWLVFGLKSCTHLISPQLTRLFAPLCAAVAGGVWWRSGRSTTRRCWPSAAGSQRAAGAGGGGRLGGAGGGVVRGSAGAGEQAALRLGAADGDPAEGTGRAGGAAGSAGRVAGGHGAAGSGAGGAVGRT